MNDQNQDNEMNAVEIKPYTRLVSLPVCPEHIFHFPEGLPAFEEFKEYIFAFKPGMSPFIFMHAVEPPGLSFVCVDPFLVCSEYAPRLGPADQEFLHIESSEEVLLLSIVTVRPDVREITANLQAPLAINMRTSIGKQIMCEGRHYPIRHRVWDAIETHENALAGDVTNGQGRGESHRPHAVHAEA